MAISDPNGGQGASGRVKSIRERFADTALVMAGVNDSMRQVRILHKKMGVPLVGRRGGRMVEIPPEEIEIDPAPAKQPGAI
jgi:hypothetical protein